MKISRLFHWLYAFLLTLPLVSSLWLGLIWTFNENAQVPTITENVSKEVDFNQRVINGNFNSGSSWNRLWVNTSVSNNIMSLTALQKNGYIYQSDISRIEGHKYLVCVSVKLTTPTTDVRALQISNGVDWALSYTLNNTNWNTYYVVFTQLLSDSSLGNFRVCQDVRSSDWDEILIKDVQCYDLTQMDLENVNSLDDFRVYFPNDFYDYTLSSHVVVDNYTTKETLDNPINYIWLPSFGGMGWTIQNVMNYLVGNLFGLVVSSGIGLAIVKLLTYWLCISLIWLVFDVIMYVPLLIHRYLDKGVLD